MLDEQTDSKSRLEIAEAQLATAKATLAAIDATRGEISLHRERRISDLEHTGDFGNHYIPFWGEVEEQSVRDFMLSLRRWSRLNPKQPLTIELNSPGGAIVVGLALFDELLALRARGHHLTIVVRGEACSMGAIILQAADKRIVGPSSFVMAHRASFGAGGEADKVEDAIEQVRMYEARMYEILGERTGKGATYWKKSLARRKDQHFSAKCALAEGLADEIG